MIFSVISNKLKTFQLPDKEVFALSEAIDQIPVPAAAILLIDNKGQSNGRPEAETTTDTEIAIASNHDNVNSTSQH